MHINLLNDAFLSIIKESKSVKKNHKLVCVCFGNCRNLQLVEGGILWSRKVKEVKAYIDVQHFALSNQIKHVCNYVLISVLWCTLRSPHKKRCSVRLYLQLFVGRLMSYLCYLCFPPHSGIQCILCIVLRFVCLPLVSFAPNAASLSGLYFLYCPFGFL